MFKKKQGRLGGFKGKCNLCGKEGHKEADCWQKESNTSKRPSEWKKSNGDEKANTRVDICLLCGCCDDDSTGVVEDTTLMMDTTNNDEENGDTENNSDVRVIDLSDYEGEIDIDPNEINDEREIDL